MIAEKLKDLLRPLAERARRRKYASSRKIFCIGRNKTGTNSMRTLFNESDIKVGPQVAFEQLIDEYFAGDYDQILALTRDTGVAFQDVPFSYPGFYELLDEKFPGSKFILTVRDSADVWYRSLVTFHAKLLGTPTAPTADQLKSASYIYPGALYKMVKTLYGTPDSDLYHEATLKQHYEDYNARVIEYFRDRPDDLLVVNLKEAGVVKKIGDFLGRTFTHAEMPWRNKTRNKTKLK